MRAVGLADTILEVAPGDSVLQWGRCVHGTAPLAFERQALGLLGGTGLAFVAGVPAPMQVARRQ